MVTPWESEAGSLHEQANRLLRALPAEARAAVAGRGRVVHLPARSVVFEPAAPMSDVYFLLAGIVSVTEVVGLPRQVTVALVGPEGMVGLPIFLQARAAVPGVTVEIEGRALCLAQPEFDAVLHDVPALDPLLRHFTDFHLEDVGRNLACAITHPLRQRTIRWLLSIADRLQRSSFPLTQQALATMLGVRRPTMSVVAQELRREGLILYRRGGLTLLDRAGLENEVCDCYWIIRGQLEQLIPA